MLKKIVILLLIIFIAPVYAGEFDNMLNRPDKVFLYLTSKNCKYCVRFNPIYYKVNKIYNDKIKFYAIDATSDEGQYFMHKFRASYVPYVIMINSKSHVSTAVEPSCLLEYACIERALNEFVK